MQGLRQSCRQGGPQVFPVCRCPYVQDRSLTPRHDRPAEVEQLLGDPGLAEKLLGWSRQVSFDELVREMVSAQETHREEAVSWSLLLGCERWK